MQADKLVFEGVPIRCKLVGVYSDEEDIPVKKYKLIKPHWVMFKSRRVATLWEHKCLMWKLVDGKDKGGVWLCCGVC